MSFRIRKDELSEELQNEIVFQEDLENIDMSSKQDKTDNNLVTESKDIVGAINELFQNANNGKEIIADAIGEPLNSEDTFAAMGSDINGLLSTFKTNLMNNGVAIEAGDKFQELINKVATMVEEGGNRGIQFAEGSINASLPKLTYANNSYSSEVNVSFSEELTFIPTLFFVHFSNFSPKSNTQDSSSYNGITIDSSMSPFYFTANYVPCNLFIENITTTGFKIRLYISGPGGLTSENITADKWYAIGVGEDDTTLRDSLASILGEEGVEVTEDDDMASLITKVNNLIDSKDEEIAAKEEELANSGGGLDVISATELPATGNENQICVITDSPTDKFILSYEASDHTDESAIFGEMLLKPSSASFITNSGSVSQKHTFFKFVQNGKTRPSYIYNNNNWNVFTPEYFYLVNNNVLDTSVFGNFYNASQYVQPSNNGLILQAYSYNYSYRVLPNEIDYSLFNKMYIKAYIDQMPTSSMSAYITVGIANINTSGGQMLINNGYMTTANVDYGNDFISTRLGRANIGIYNTSIQPVEMTIDISNINAKGRMCIELYSSNTNRHFLINDLYFY